MQICKWMFNSDAKGGADTNGSKFYGNEEGCKLLIIVDNLEEGSMESLKEQGRNRAKM